MTTIDLLLNPQLIAILTPAGVLLLVGCWLLYKNYTKVLQNYIDLQEKRVQENQAMVKTYYDLANDINRTLDLLMTTLGRRNSDPGNGNGGK